MTLTAGSAGVSKRGAGRKRKASNISRLPLKERTTKEQERLVQISLMSHAGLPVKVIANDLQLSRHTVSKYLKKQREFFPHLQSVEHYKTNKQALIESVESQALQSIAEGLVKPDVSLKDSTLAFKILHQSNRLESNQSTANVNNNIQFSMTPLSKAQDS
jgi:predicted transcriptional regulator